MQKADLPIPWVYAVSCAKYVGEVAVPSTSNSQFLHLTKLSVYTPFPLLAVSKTLTFDVLSVFHLPMPEHSWLNHDVHGLIRSEKRASMAQS